MEITHESSIKYFNELAGKDLSTQEKFTKKLRKDFYKQNGKSPVSIVRTDDRGIGIQKSINLIGGLKPILDNLKGDILIKPNGNHDEKFPRNSHPETVRNLATQLIHSGVNTSNIVIGEMSGMYRGLPTRITMENLGIKKIADELDIDICYFDEEEWVKINSDEFEYWPDGVFLPKRVYDADRIIMTPIIRPHTSANFSMVMKLSVGMMDAKSRNYLHNGTNFYEKLIYFNRAFSVDLSVIDGLEFFIDRGPNFKQKIKAGIFIAGSNRVSTDAIAASVLKFYNGYNLDKKPINQQEQIILAKKLHLGKSSINDINIKSENMENDQVFDSLIEFIKKELK